MAFTLKDKFIKKRGLTFTKVLLALAFGFASSVYIWRPTAIELRKQNEQMNEEDTKNYTI